MDGRTDDYITDGKIIFLHPQRSICTTCRTGKILSKSVALCK